MTPAARESSRIPSNRASLKPSESHKPVADIAGFEIIHKIGQGAMGAVFKARQRSLDRIVALKILPPRIAASSKFIERFQREARTSAKLCHSNIVQGIDVGQDPRSKLWYFAMELVDGPSVKELIKLRTQLNERRALEIAGEVADALEAIDRAGMIHRDIKPDNILLTSTGLVKVADLGLARVSDDDAGMTQTGQAVGTPHYMSPEQVRGETDVNIRADLYALGATLFHMVTGKTPFHGGSSVEIMTKHLHDPAPLASDVNPNVSADCSKLIARLMEKKREDREQTPRKLRKRIDALLGRGAESTDIATPIVAHPQLPIRASSHHGIKAAAKHEIHGHSTHGAARPHRVPPQGSEKSVWTNRVIFAGPAAAVVIIAALMAAFSGKPAPIDKTVDDPVRVDAKAAPQAETSARPQVSNPAVADANPAGDRHKSGFDITGGEDIHESIARGKLDEIERLEKAGKLTPADLQARYKDLSESSLRGTHAAVVAGERLKKLPPPVPAAIAKGVWWEGEDTIENNFISHVWLAEQLDKRNLSGGRYLNHLSDEKWIKMQGKSSTNKLHATYSVDVPADATYTLWVREYDPYNGMPWQFRWDDAKWFSVPADYPFENKVEIGKDRWMVWRNYPRQTLTKGRHTFQLEGTLDGKHQIAAFDCFYLTTEPFKPEGTKKP